MQRSPYIFFFSIQIFMHLAKTYCLFWRFMGVFNTTIRWEDIMSLQKNLSVKTDIRTNSVEILLRTMIGSYKALSSHLRLLSRTCSWDFLEMLKDICQITTAKIMNKSWWLACDVGEHQIFHFLLCTTNIKKIISLHWQQVRLNSNH
jgi:hypothetical protein